MKRAFPGLRASSGEDFNEQFGSTIAIFNAIILSVALISVVVGGLSVINTMTISVAERTREIGIKRAIGATRGRIMRELVWEAGVMGFVGGLAGLGLAWLVVYFSNDAGQVSGIILFRLTPWIAALGRDFLDNPGSISRTVSRLEGSPTGSRGSTEVRIGNSTWPFWKHATFTRRTG